MVKRKCKHPKFDVIVCVQGQPFHYYHSTMIGALVEYAYQYLRKNKYGTMNFTLKQVFFIKEDQVSEKLPESDTDVTAILTEFLNAYKMQQESEE